MKPVLAIGYQLLARCRCQLLARWALVASLLATACARRGPSAPTAADVKAFLDNANATTLRLGIQANRAGWVQETYITDDTEAMSALASQAANDAGARFAKEATRYDHVDVPPDERRQLTLL